MKKLFLLPILLLSLLSTSCWGVDWDDLVERDGIYYEKFSDTPYTGKVNGEEKGKLKEGKKNGRWIAYHDNGKKKLKGVYKNGEPEGKWVHYWYNGNVFEKKTYKNGKREGKWQWYTWEGNLYAQTFFKNDKEEGEATEYHKNNGRLHRKGTYRNGLKDGKWIFLDAGGTVIKQLAGTYKDGKKISD